MMEFEEMEYREAMKYLTTVEWKTQECKRGNCWCRLIVPKEKIFDKYGNDIIVQPEAICIDLAEYIVKIHNESLKIYKDKNI